VTGPAAEAGLVVEPAVAEAVITELRGEAGGGLGTGVLPLMSQAMAATAHRPAAGRGHLARLPHRPGRLRHGELADGASTTRHPAR